VTPEKAKEKTAAWAPPEGRGFWLGEGKAFLAFFSNDAKGKGYASFFPGARDGVQRCSAARTGSSVEALCKDARASHGEAVTGRWHPGEAQVASGYERQE